MIAKNYTNVPIKQVFCEFFRFFKLFFKPYAKNMV